ncbi:MAG: transcriptional activator NhaR [Planctomycetota bacterium]
MLDWLNYHHLLYFWMVAKQGSITAAAEQLHLSQPTLSTQIQKLEKSMGVKLFDRQGRSLRLTDTGQMVFRYADDIFSLGQELQDSLRGRPNEETVRLLVGVPDVLPKLIIYQLLKPALAMTPKTHLVCTEGKSHELLTDLAMHRLDIVLANAPLTPEMNVRAFNHLLGQSDVSVCGAPELAERYQPDFPKSLHGAPMLLPTQNTTLRRAIEQWFDRHEIRPEVVHEFEDTALLKVFAQAGEGLIVLPRVIAADVEQKYALVSVGRINEITESYYAISIERRLKHPSVIAISEAARSSLFTLADSSAQ